MNIFAEYYAVCEHNKMNAHKKYENHYSTFYSEFYNMRNSAIMNYNDLGVEFKYLIVNEKDKKFGISVNTVGFQSIQPNTPYPLTDHPSGYFFNAQKGRVLRE